MMSLVACLLAFLIISLIKNKWQSILKNEGVDAAGVEENSNIYQEYTLQQLDKLHLRLKVERREAIEELNYLNKFKV